MEALKSKTRIKKNGEIFTPEYIVDEMLALLPDGILDDASKTFLDPTCGNGNILVTILKRRIELGLDPTASCNSLYGIDLMPDNVKECIERLLELAPYSKPNVKQHDFFEVDWNGTWDDIGKQSDTESLF
jgi:hypothetical protein